MWKWHSRVIGIAELLAAILLLLIGWTMPSQATVEEAFGSARHIASVSRRHVEGTQDIANVAHQGAQALHTVIQSLSAGMKVASAVEYPEITRSLPLPSVKWRPLWADSQKLTAEIQKMAESSKATEQQASDLQRDLPQVAEQLGALERSLTQLGSDTARSFWYARMLIHVVALIVAVHAIAIIIANARPESQVLT